METTVFPKQRCRHILGTGTLAILLLILGVGCQDLPQVKDQSRTEASTTKKIVHESANSFSIEGEWSMLIQIPLETETFGKFRDLIVNFKREDKRLRGKGIIPDAYGRAPVEGEIEGVINGQDLTFIIHFPDRILGPFEAKLSSSKGHLLFGEVRLQPGKPADSWLIKRVG